jgi:hypothetical protein
MIKWTFHCSTFFALLMLNASAGAVVLSVADLAPNDLIITEYLADPVGVSDSLGEYFEIFNTTAADIDLAGLIVRDDGSNSFTVSAATVGAGAFAIFSGSDGSSLGLTPDYVYGGSMSLTNTDDEIGLFRPDDSLISKMVYTDGDFFGDGIAHELAAINSGTPSVLTGPASGTDFVGATLALPLGNFGSPGFAGGTTIQPPAVPVPAAVWMFGSALSILGWMRRKTSGRINRKHDQRHKGGPDAKINGSTRLCRNPDSVFGAGRHLADGGRVRC